MVADESLESRLERGDVEVHQQRGVEVGELEVGDDLSLMDGEEKLDRLDLDDDPLVDDKVEAIAAVEQYALVFQGKRPLVLERDAAEGELAAQARFVCRLEQPRAQMPVDLDAGADDLLGAIPKTSCLRVFLCFSEAERSRGMNPRSSDAMLVLSAHLCFECVGQRFSGRRFQPDDQPRNRAT